MLHNLCEASAQAPEATITWFNEVNNKSFEELADSGGEEWVRFDIKLGNMLSNTIRQAKMSLTDDLQFHSEAATRANTILKGRQIAWMMMDFNKTNKNLTTVYSITDLYRIQWKGDNNISRFRFAWRNTVANLPYKLDDLAMRDLLYNCMKQSKVLAPDLAHYDRQTEDHQDRSYQYLLDCIERYIANNRLEVSRQAQASHIANGAPAAGADNNKGKGGKGKGGKGKGKDNKGGGGKNGGKSNSQGPKGGNKGKGKGKGNASDRAQSGSGRNSALRVDASGEQRLCFFYERGFCKKGNDCPDAHIRKPNPKGDHNHPGPPKGNSKGNSKNKGDNGKAGNRSNSKGAGKNNKGGKGSGGKAAPATTSAAALPSPPVPKVCQDYLSPAGCTKFPCPDLHVPEMVAKDCQDKMASYKKEATKVRRANNKASREGQ